MIGRLSMILYQCDACGKWRDDIEGGCSDDCGYLENWSEPHFLLEKSEARAIVQELSRTFIDRDNPLCNQVLTKLSKFVDDK